MLHQTWESDTSETQAPLLCVMPSPPPLPTCALTHWAREPGESHPHHMNQALWQGSVRSGITETITSLSFCCSLSCHCELGKRVAGWPSKGIYFRWWRDKSDHFWSKEGSTEGAFLAVALWDVNGTVALKEGQVSDAKRESVTVHAFLWDLDH